MTAFLNRRQRDIVTFSEHGEDANGGLLERPLAGLDAMGFALARHEVHVFDHAQLNATLRARDGDIQPFPGAIGEQAVRQDRAAAVAGRHGDRVFDGDWLAKDVAIADIAVVGFRFEVQAT